MTGYQIIRKRDNLPVCPPFEQRGDALEEVRDLQFSPGGYFVESVRLITPGQAYIDKKLRTRILNSG